MVTAATISRAKVLQWPEARPVLVRPTAPAPEPFVLVPPDPMSPEKKTRKPRRRRKPPVSLSDEQLLALLAKAKERRQRDYVMILITYWHGLRASETVNLRENDFNLDDGTVQIVRGKGSEGGSHTLQEFPKNPLLDEAVVVADWLKNRGKFGVKGGAKRQSGKARPRSSTDGLLPGPASLPLAPERRTEPSTMIAEPSKMQQSMQIVAFSPADHEFPLSQGLKPAGGSEPLAYPPEAASGLPIERVPPQNVESDQNPRLFPIGRIQFWRIVHGYALAAGIPRRKCKTHMLKHTIAKHLVRAGHPLNEIQEWMGWSTIETMNWYTRADEEELGNRIGATIRSKDGLRQVQQGRLFP